MEVTGKSNAVVVLESCLQESTIYFSDHQRILKCNPYCTHVEYLREFDVFQWTFEVDDPRSNPIVAVFFVKQSQEILPVDSPAFCRCATRNRHEVDMQRPGKKIRWTTADAVPGMTPYNSHTFIGTTHSEICLLHQSDKRTAVHFETNISVDFQLSFPLNLMPEPVLKLMSDAIMSKIMQQATESMLCQVQADICSSAPEISAEGGKR